jgi:hypothetical protein
MQEPCTPERLLAIRRQYHNLIEVPFVATARRSLTDAIGEFSAAFESSLPDRLVRYRDAAGGQHLLHHA